MGSKYKQPIEKQVILFNLIKEMKQTFLSKNMISKNRFSNWYAKVFESMKKKIMTKVSTIHICYNMSKYMKGFLDNLSTQTHKDLEIVLDDHNDPSDEEVKDI